MLFCVQVKPYYVLAVFQVFGDIIHKVNNSMLSGVSFSETKLGF